MSQNAALTIDEQKLAGVWDEHLRAEFKAHSVDEALATRDHLSVHQNKKAAIPPGDNINPTSELRARRETSPFSEELVFRAGDVLCTAFFTPYRSPLIVRRSAIGG